MLKSKAHVEIIKTRTSSDKKVEPNVNKQVYSHEFYNIHYVDL